MCVCVCVSVCCCVCLPTCLFVCLSITPKAHQEGASTYTRTPNHHNNRGSSTSKQRTATKTLTATASTPQKQTNETPNTRFGKCCSFGCAITVSVHPPNQTATASEHKRVITVISSDNRWLGEGGSRKAQATSQFSDLCKAYQAGIRAIGRGCICIALRLQMVGL